jgi:probable addiction module antidote protein
MARKENPLGLAPFDPAEYLTDESAIAEFLNVSFAMNDPAVTLNALNTVARARGMTELARTAGVGRENLYNALKPGAKPRFETILKLMDAMGLALHAEVKLPAEPAGNSAGGAQHRASAVSRASSESPARAAPRAARGKRPARV